MKTPVPVVEMTWEEMTEWFCKYNKTKPPVDPVKGYIVFASASYNQFYPVKSRTYCVNNEANWFHDGRFSTSLRGDCLDGSDRGVRLDAYMRDFGNKNGWIVDYCYIPEITLNGIKLALKDSDIKWEK